MTSTITQVPVLPDSEVGEPVPPLTHHAVSVSLPTWEDCVGYEEGDERVVSRMKTGYPRFFVHKSIQRLGNDLLLKYGSPDQCIWLYPSRKVADLFVDFVIRRSEGNCLSTQVHILELIATKTSEERSSASQLVSPAIYGCTLPKQHSSLAKQFWQHAGAGISSRRADYCQALFTAGHLVVKGKDEASSTLCKGPRRYRRRTVTEEDDTAQEEPEGKDQGGFIEERFGRNLNINLASEAKSSIKKRIMGALLHDTDHRQQLAEEDVYLFPTGMNAIFASHQVLLRSMEPCKSICYGFPYIDTLKILEKFGPGCTFYGHGSSEELDHLEQRLKQGEKILGLFCEFPGNPLLKSPDMVRIRSLADRYGFAVVVDETVGNFVNINVLPYADIVVSSLTKIFSGDSNVMGGSAILNHAGPLYSRLKQTWSTEYEDIYWAEDAIFMERNSRDFVSRAERVNANAEAIVELLLNHSRVKEVYYPKISPTRAFYDQCRTEHGGYGGLLSVTFHTKEDAVKFYDNINTYKGPSLGTNFTLSSPYVILAHYTELPWAASFGVEPDLVRFSVGLEHTSELISTFQQALQSLG